MGVIRDYASRCTSKVFGENSADPAAAIDTIFGTGADAKNFSAGTLGFGEARILAFPLRSAKGSYALATKSPPK